MHAILLADTERSPVVLNATSCIGVGPASVLHTGRRTVRCSVKVSIFPIYIYQGWTTYSHGICLRTVHVSQKEISKLHRIQPGQGQSPVRIRPPLSTAMVEHACRQKEQNQGQPDEHDRPIDVHVVDNEEIEPHKQAQKEKEERWYLFGQSESPTRGHKLKVQVNNSPLTIDAIPMHASHQTRK